MTPAVFVALFFAAEPAMNAVVQRGHSGSIVARALSPDDRLIVSGGSDGTLILWDVNTGGEIRSMGSGGGSPKSFVFHPDRKRLFVGATNIDVYDLENGARLHSIPPGKCETGDMVLRPDGKLI